MIHLNARRMLINHLLIDQLIGRRMQSSTSELQLNDQSSTSSSRPNDRTFTSGSLPNNQSSISWLLSNDRTSSSFHTPIEDEDQEEIPLANELYFIAQDRPRTVITPPQRHSEYIVTYALSTTEETGDDDEPSRFFEAVSCLDSSKWIQAMDEQLQSLH